MAVRTIAWCVLASISIATTPGRPAAQPQATSILHANIVSVSETGREQLAYATRSLKE